MGGIGGGAVRPRNHGAHIAAKTRRAIWARSVEDERGFATMLETKQTMGVGRVPAEVTFTNDGTSVDREPVGAWPGADGIMYVDREVAKTIKAIDPKTLEIVRRSPLGFTPGLAAVAPTRTSELWVIDANAGKVGSHETASEAKMAELPTATGAHALAFTPAGSTAFASNELANSLSSSTRRRER